ncbi:MAG: nitrite reductase, copper-containing, partial [Bdellovibrionales bacterium]|nr:nitrite reductase, copper-containing [Bdellovibrionales bacterium]
SDYLNADVDRAIGVVLNGLSGEITVNGKKYQSVMPAQVLTDEEVASVMTYIYNSWDNNGTEVTVEQVKKNRNK